MKKWLAYLPSLFLLLLFSGAALADASNPTIYSSAVAGKTDVSIAFLSSLFGTVSGVLSGTSGQMFGKLMYQFNQGMLVVAGCWLGFSVLSMVFKSATTGSFMQQDNKVAMILLRVSFGFSLLIPNPSTGYTLLQGIVMQVTVQGVKLANQVWDYGLDYMKAGGALWSRPVQQGGKGMAGADAIFSSSDLKSILGDPTRTNSQVVVSADSTTNNFDNLGMVQKVMAMEACMVQMSINLTTNSDGDSDSVASPSSNAALSIYEDLDGSGFEFPGGYTIGNIRSQGCGEVYWNSLSSDPNKKLSGCSATSGGDDNTDCGFSHLALKEVVYGVLPAVKKYVCLANTGNKSSVCSGLESDDSDPYMTDAMMNAALSYKNLIDPIVRKAALAAKNGGVSCSTTGASKGHEFGEINCSGGGAAVTGGGDGMNFYAQAKNDGWMVAGRYYWDILRIEDKYDVAVTNSVQYRQYLPGVYISPGTPDMGSQPTSDAFTKAATPLMQDTTGPKGYVQLVNDFIKKYSGAASSGNAAVASMSNAITSLGALKVFTLFYPIMSTIMDAIMLILNFSAYAGPFGLGAEPIFWLHKLGLSCISLGLNLWLAIAVTIVPATMIMASCSALNPAGFTYKALLDWLQPVIMMAAGGFVAVGFTLGFYLPLYPYMLFTFGVIGWIISVTEAMVAAPLVALGITHPEGHDFLGRATQGMMLLVGLFLRPVLMLIGLFASMILCQVAMSIILYTFSGFCADLFFIAHPISGQPTAGDPVLQAAGNVMANIFAEGRGSGFGMLVMTLLVFPMFLGVFTMLVYTATVTSFSLIHQLPDYIMAWIGGPNHHGASAKDMADQVKQGMSGAGHKMGEGIGHSKKMDKPGGKGTTDIPTIPKFQGGGKGTGKGTGKNSKINQGKTGNWED